MSRILFTCADTPLDRLGRHTPPGRHPLGRHPPGPTPAPGQTRQTPPQIETPLGRHPHSRRLLQRTVRILLEFILVLISFLILIQNHNILSEHKETKGWFGREFVTNVTFCPLIGSDLQVFDVNTDGFDDLVCHTSNGTITITESHIVDQRPSGISADTG